MEDYLKKRQDFEREITTAKYNGIAFTPLEEETNKLYRQILISERATKDDSFYKGYTLKHREQFEKESHIFKAIQKLPKGAVLHIHTDCCMDIDWFMEELAYHENTYFNQETSTFKYFQNAEKAESGFKNLRQEREKASDKAQFDAEIRKCLFVQEEDRMVSKENIWKAFEKKIMSISGVIYFREHFPRYMKRYLENFIKDGVIHIEARAFLGFTFNEDGFNLSVNEEMDMISTVLNEIKAEHPYFTFQLIIQGLKMWDVNQVEQYMRDALIAKKHHPELICAFDMVQEEDAFKTMIELAPALIKMKEMQAEIGVELPFVFHGGESLHTLKNTNLFDVLLLGTKRIGHGINLSQHSYLLEKIKNDEVCLEICPVSNQILKYIDDIRLHPIKTFLNYGVKVSINPDDPGFFGYNGVSMDFFFVSFGTQLDYKDLKLCAYNSIQYSFLSDDQKKAAWEELEKRFQVWCKWFIESNLSS
ncbi:hypothetical protein ABPG72_002385 [Tetrahymena utriculariae]